MRRIHAILTTLLLVGIPTQGEDSAQLVRVRFVPLDTHEVCGGGATFTKLCPAPGRAGTMFALVHAGLRDTFPIQDTLGHLLFRVDVTDATDDQFVLEVKNESGKELRAIKLPRNKAITVTVTGGSFEFYYPETQVSSTGKPTTNKALLIITRLPPDCKQ